MAWMHGRRAVLGGAVAVVALLVGMGLLVVQPWASEANWSAAPGTAEGLDPTHFTMHPNDDSNGQRWMSAEELHANYPLSIELPREMPPGYRLFWIDLFEFRQGANAVAENWLSARYVSDDEVPEIIFNQSPGHERGSFEGAETVRVGDVEALYGTRGEPYMYDRLWWSRCGRRYDLQGHPPGAFSQADLIRIAASVGPEEC